MVRLKIYFLFFSNIQRPVLGFSILPSGHTLGSLGGFSGEDLERSSDFFLFFDKIQRPVLGFNTLPSGHTLDGF